MKCYGVPEGGKRVCVDDAFTIHVPYGAVYNFDASVGNQKGFIFIPNQIPDGYAEGLIDLQDNVEGTRFRFSAGQDLSGVPKEKYNELLEKRDTIMAENDSINSRKELYADDTVAVIRVHLETENKRESDMGGGMKRVVTSKYTTYLCTVVSPKSLYICTSSDHGMGIFKIDDNKGDGFLSSVRSADYKED